MIKRDELEIVQPDDFHHHLRDGFDILSDVIRHTSRQFHRVICMPNLAPPVTKVKAASEYRERILEAARSVGATDFEPLMTLYLTKQTTREEIYLAKDCGFVHGFKYYPAGATTHSEWGVSDLATVQPVLKAMEEVGIPLLIHGESPAIHVDIFDREKVFIENVLSPIVNALPQLKIVLEHITTKDAVDFVLSSREGIHATITAHHLLLNRNALFEGGKLRPHHFCMPVLKREEHRVALLQAATSGNSKFFIGTDSAPHPVSSKENSCGCAGIFTAHAALELYAEAFDSVDALDKLEAFTSIYGQTFYGLPLNEKRVKLIRREKKIEESFSFGNKGEILKPLRAGESIAWTLEA